MKRRMNRYLGIALFGTVSLITALTLTVMVTQWDGVLYVLLGTA